MQRGLKKLNSRAEEILFEKYKRDFAHRLSTAAPPMPDNHIKLRKALLEIMQELNSANIRCTMNLCTGILGRFYEQLLKYGNDSKEIGVVLTPHHIAKISALTNNYLS